MVESVETKNNTDASTSASNNTISQESINAAIDGSAKRVVEGLKTEWQKEAEVKELSGLNSKIDGYTKEISGNSAIETMLKTSKKILEKLSKEDRNEYMKSIEDTVTAFKQKDVGDQRPSLGGIGVAPLSEERYNNIAYNFIDGQVDPAEEELMKQHMRTKYPDKFKKFNV